MTRPEDLAGTPWYPASDVRDGTHLFVVNVSIQGSGSVDPPVPLRTQRVRAFSLDAALQACRLLPFPAWFEEENLVTKRDGATDGERDRPGTGPGT